MTRVQIAGVAKKYPARGKQGEDFYALQDVNIDIASGEIHAVIGHSGAGKSTLLRLINGLERATSGSIHVGDAEITALPERELRKVRPGIGMIFQQFNLLHSRRVAGNVAYPLRLAGISKEQREQRVTELLDFVGLADRRDAYPEQLSGGQKQRVGIARALATNPGVLLCDEATSALDPQTSQEVLQLLRRASREFGVTVILITHEMEVVRDIADRVTVLAAGKVIEQGGVFEVFSNPQKDTTKSFVSTVLPLEPNAEHLQALKEKHTGRLVALTFRDGAEDQPLVFQTLAERGVGVNIIHGGIADIGGRSFGKLTLQLIGDDLRVQHAIAALGQIAELEVLV